MSKHISPLVILAVAATVSAPAFAQQSSTGPSWQALRSTINRSVDVDDSFNRSETNTDASQRTSLDLDAQVDASRNADGSFNRSVDASRNADESFNTDNSQRTDLDLQAQIDASRKAKDSFNTTTDNSREANDSFNRDASNKAWDSYNTDASSHIADSYNTDKSIKDSYNSDWRQSIDKQSVSPTVNTHKSVTTADTQDQAQNGVMYGPQQSGTQGGFTMGSLISESPRGAVSGGGYKSPTVVSPSYRLKQSNSSYVGGPNLGAISNVNVANQGGEQVMGPKGSIIGSDLGNKQSFYAGDMQQMQNAEQLKSSATSSNASDTVITNASK